MLRALEFLEIKAKSSGGHSPGKPLCRSQTGRSPFLLDQNSTRNASWPVLLPAFSALCTPVSFPKVQGEATSRAHSPTFRNVGLSASAPKKLAKLLLDFRATGQQTKEGARVKLPLTHEELAVFIGTTHETVAREL
jgi:hypothetical protein